MIDNARFLEYCCDHGRKQQKDERLRHDRTG